MDRISKSKTGQRVTFITPKLSAIFGRSSSRYFLEGLQRRCSLQKRYSSAAFFQHIPSASMCWHFFADSPLSMNRASNLLDTIR